MRAVILAIALLISLPHKSYAAPETQGNPNNIGKLYDQYATIAGGWYMNKKCSVLDADKSKELEWYVGKITVAMGHLTKNTSMLQTLQQAAKKTTESDKYKNCGEESSKIVLGSFERAKDLNLALTHNAYQAGVSDVEDILNKYISAKIGLEVNKKCNLLSKDIKDDAEKVADKLAEKLLAKYPDKYLIAYEHVKENTAKVKDVDCKKENTKSLVVMALSELQQLENALANTK